MTPRYLVSLLCFTLGDLWSKTYLFKTYGYGYKAYAWLMDVSFSLDDEGKIWKRPEPQEVIKSRRRRALKLNKKR